MIDDIDYLKENSETDSIVIFVDSKNRDYTVYPTPSEYAIIFEQPFRNVVSVEVLDASIPTVMYTVDTNQSQFYFSIMSPSSANVYDITQITLEMSVSVTFATLFDQVDSGNQILICSESQLVNYQSFIANGHYMYNSTFNIAIRNVKENNSIHVYDIQDATEFFTFIFQKGCYCMLNIPSNQTTIQLIQSNNFFLELNSQNTYDIVYYTYISVTNDEFNQIQNDQNYWCCFQNIRYTISPLGNYDIISLKNQMNLDLYDYGITISTIGKDESFQGLYVFTCPNLFLINSSLDQLDNIIGFDCLPQPYSIAQKYVNLTVGTNQKVFMSENANGAYQLIAPGLVNLKGSRYLILRCQELEHFTSMSFAYNSCTPGIGMFKMESDQNRTTSLRWDFTTLNPRSLHPIGKLTRMTFRFEMPNGNLYDFKFINHQFLLVIKFFQPYKKHKFTRSVLNPNYTPDLMKYMSTNKDMISRIPKEVEIDDEDAEFDVYNKEINKMVIQMDRL